VCFSGTFHITLSEKGDFTCVISSTKAKRGSDFSEPLWVPGTGTDDVANNPASRNWWILKEMPL